MSCIRAEVRFWNEAGQEFALGCDLDGDLDRNERMINALILCFKKSLAEHTEKLRFMQADELKVRAVK